MTPEQPEDSAARTERERRERAASLLGGLLPDSGEDAAALDWGENREGRSRDDELRRDLPPHHGKD